MRWEDSKSSQRSCKNKEWNKTNYSKHEECTSEFKAKNYSCTKVNESCSSQEVSE